MPESTYVRWVKLFLVLGFALRCAHALMPPEWTLYHTVIDDAYYNLEVVGHLLAGQGLTFDGRNATNGYHLLWMFLNAPVVWLTGGDPAMSTKGLLLMASLVDLGIGVSLVAFLWRISTAGFATLVAGAWAFHSSFFLLCLNGLDTPLVGLLTLFAFGYYAVWQSGRSEPAPLRFALLVVLAFWARVDGLILVMVFAAWEVVRTRRTGLPYRTLIVLALGCIPYFLYEWLAYGMLTPTSGKALRLHLSQVGEGFNTAYLFEEYARFFGAQSLSLVSSPAVAVAVAGALVLFLCGNALRRGRGLSSALFLAAVAVAYLVVYSVHLYPRPRYVFPALLAVLLLLGIGHREALRLVAYRRAAPLLGAAVLIGVLISSGHALGRPSVVGGFQRILVDRGVEILESRTAADDRVGAFNAGILAWFGDREIVNLDGLINNSAYEALRDRRFVEYLREQDIDYILDWGQQLDFYFRNYAEPEDLGQLTLVLDETHELEHPAGTFHLMLWKASW